MTAVAPVKFVPVKVTVVPADPLVGVKPVIVGVVAADRERPASSREMSNPAKCDQSLWLLRLANADLLTVASKRAMPTETGPMNCRRQAPSMCNLVRFRAESGKIPYAGWKIDPKVAEKTV